MAVPVLQKQSVKQARAGLYRRLFIEAGELVFARQGYNAAKVQDIAARAGLSLGTFYGVFDGKDDLYNAIHEYRGEQLNEIAIASMHSNRAAIENLFRGMADYLTFFLQHHDYLRIHINDGAAWALDSGLETPAQMETWRRGLAAMQQVIDFAIAAGDMLHEPSHRLARILTATHQVRLAEWLEHPRPGNQDALIADILWFTARAYLTEKGREQVTPLIQHYETTRNRPQENNV